MGVVAWFGSIFLLSWAVGDGTSWLLGRLDMLDVDAYYRGTEQIRLVTAPAFWLLVAIYVAPILTAATTARLLGGSSRLRARLSWAALVAAALWVVGVMVYAFDPSRGNHEPLVFRYEELSYEAADLVLAATWTMLVTAVLVVAASGARTAKVHIGAGAVVAVVSGLIFGTAFG